MVKKIPVQIGSAALRAWQAGEASRTELFTAVRFTLQQLAEKYPGRAVEVRVPPAGAVQILSGTTHRRGTPPAVVEMDAQTWLELCVGRVEWDVAVGQNRVEASGERTDLGGLLPL